MEMVIYGKLFKTKQRLFYMLSISVAIITFNGEKYIYEQLESIRIQSLPPKRVLIFDDCSSDKTVDVISEFIETNNLSHWQLFKRIFNVGWRQNIFEALMQCDTDIIFWSDQDDVWESNKIEILTSLIKEKSCLAAYSSWRYIDSSGNLLGIFSGENTCETVEINPFIRSSNIPPLLGCSACFKRELVLQLQKIFPCEFDSPDWILYFLAISTGKVLYIDQPLFKRRVHDNNLTTSLNTLHNSWNFNYYKRAESLKVLKLQLKTLDKIIRVVKKVSLDSGNYFIEYERDYLNCRIQFLENHDCVLKYLYLSYKENYLSDFIRTIVDDVLFVCISCFKRIK